MAETESETVERLAEERAIEIIDSLKATFKKQFKEELPDDFIIEQINIKIEESKASLVQHMLSQLCSMVMEPADFYRARKMLVKRNTPKAVEPTPQPEAVNVARKSGRPARPK